MAGTVYPVLPMANAGFRMRGKVKATSSRYFLDIRADLAAAVGNNTASLNGAIRGIIQGVALSKTAVLQAGIHGVYWVTTSNASLWPKAAVLGEIHDASQSADGGVVSLFVSGNSPTGTVANAYFTGLNMGSGGTLTYGLDIGGAVSGSSAKTFETADIRFSSGGLLATFTSAITANTTTTTLAAGTLGKTTNATGRASLFVSDGSKWQFLTNA